MVGQLTIPDSSGVSNFFLVDTLSDGWECLIEPDDISTIVDANGRLLRTCSINNPSDRSVGSIRVGDLVERQKKRGTVNNA